MQARQPSHRFKIFRKNAQRPIGASIQKYFIQNGEGRGHFG